MNTIRYRNFIYGKGAICLKNDFEIIRLDKNSEYQYLVVLCSSDSPYEYIESIARNLRGASENVKILIDEILHVGNTDKRYIEFTMSCGKLVNGKIVQIPKNSEYRALSCKFLKDNDVLKDSIITSIQYRMINKGIVI
jgi:exosome complex RNA-binding protein Rrp4